MIDREPVGILDQNAVVREKSRETPVGGRERQRLFERLAISVNRKVAKIDAAAAVTTQNRASLKAPGSAES